LLQDFPIAGVEADTCVIEDNPSRIETNTAVMDLRIGQAYRLPRVIQ
jgi:hypothetical protein